MLNKQLKYDIYTNLITQELTDETLTIIEKAVNRLIQQIPPNYNPQKNNFVVDFKYEKKDINYYLLRELRFSKIRLKQNDVKVDYLLFTGMSLEKQEKGDLYIKLWFSPSVIKYLISKSPSVKLTGAIGVQCGNRYMNVVTSEIIKAEQEVFSNC